MKRGDILLCDLDAFYASVEQLDNPELRGKPVIVGGESHNRGVVSTCSYEARAYGVRSAMPMKTARKLCPHGIYLPVNMKRYQELSAKVFTIYTRFTPLIEVVSIDEAYLEVKQHNGIAVANEIRKMIKEELELTVSIGVSSNKLLAKISSNMAKPNGLKELWPKDATKVLGDYSVRIIPGIGPKTVNKLREYGIDKISQLQTYPLKWFRDYFGARGDELFNFVQWKDERPLVLERVPKSIGEEITFSEDIAEKAQITSMLNSLSAEVGYRLRSSGFLARTATIKVRYFDFQTITRSSSQANLLYTDQDIFKISVALYNTLKNHKPIRLIGIQVSNFEKDVQLSLFNENDEKKVKLANIVDQLNDKYGSKIVRRGAGNFRPRP